MFAPISILTYLLLLDKFQIIKITYNFVIINNCIKFKKTFAPVKQLTNPKPFLNEILAEKNK